MNDMGIYANLFYNFKKNRYEYVKTEDGNYYIFYADKNDNNQFSIFSDLTTSDAVIFKQPIGSKLQVIYTIPLSWNIFLDDKNLSVYHLYQLNLMVSNYFVCNRNMERIQIFRSDIAPESAMRRIQYISGESVKYTLSALKYILQEASVKIWES